MTRRDRRLYAAAVNRANAVLIAVLYPATILAVITALHI